MHQSAVPSHPFYKLLRQREAGMFKGVGSVKISRRHPYVGWKPAARSQAACICLGVPPPHTVESFVLRKDQNIGYFLSLTM